MVACPVWCPSSRRSLGPPSCWIRSPVTSCWLTPSSMSSDVTCSRFTGTLSIRIRGKVAVEEVVPCWETYDIATGELYFFSQGPWHYLLWSNEPADSDVQVKICVQMRCVAFSRHKETITISFFLPEWSLQPLISFLAAALQLIWGSFIMPFRLASSLNCPVKFYSSTTALMTTLNVSMFFLSCRILATSTQNSKRRWNPNTSDRRLNSNFVTRGLESELHTVNFPLHTLCRTREQCNKNPPRLIMRNLKYVHLFWNAYRLTA